MRKVHQLEQGSPEWHAHRATPGVINGSEIAAIMGLSSYVSRSELLRRKATGIEPEHDPATLERFADGHRTEALARPLAEEIIGDDLSPLVITDEIDGMLFSVSLDGITQGSDITSEHKRLNAKLAEALDAGFLPDEYHPQCESGLMVSGAATCLFMASKWEKAPGIDEEPGKVYGFIIDENGNEVRYALVDKKHFWYKPNNALRAKIIAACKQFAEDLANYQHVEHAERPAAQVSIELPALYVQARGAITDSNMVAYGEALKTRLAEVRAIQLVTDQDFSNAKAAATLFRDQVKKLKLAKEAMLAQTVSIGEAARMIDAWSEDLRTTALQLEKDVEREDAAKKAAIVAGVREKYADHLKALNARIGGNWMPLLAPDFAGALKNKRSYSSMQDAVDTALANAKMDADAIAATIKTNREQLAGEAHDFMFLFPDFSRVCTKAPEDFALLVGARVAAEEKRIEEAAKKAAEKPVDVIQQSDMGQSLDGLAGKSQRTPAEAVAAHHDTNDEAIIDDFLRLLAISPVDKKALRAHLVKFEKYRIAREMQVAA